MALSVFVEGEVLSRAHLILEDNVQGVDNSWNVTKDGQKNVNEEIGAASTLEENTEGWEDDGEDDFADIASSGRHFAGCLRR